MEIINPGQFLEKLVPLLDELQIPYFITGGLAVSVWGRPRATFDIDIVIQLMSSKVKLLGKALHLLAEAGYFDEEMANDAIDKKGEFNFIEPETGLKIDFWVSKDDVFAQSCWKRRKLVSLGKLETWFISPEDLILSKLLWHAKSQSTRQLEDIESVLKIFSDRLDMNYLKNWAGQLGVLEEFNKLI